jgi:diguanylate cyclase (GGDEF)-like protein
VAASSDPTWVRLDELPERNTMPAHASCAEQQKVIRIDDVRTDDGAPAGCTVLFPMAAHGEQATVLELQCPGPFSNESLQTADSVLRVYRNFCGLLDYSERDTLTGLLNRKTFDESFYKVSAIAAPTSTPGNDRRCDAAATRHFIGVIDIDHFKHVNDSFGHLIGDEVLLLLSRLMRSSFRFHDRLYRFGGEEFSVVMRCSGDGDAALAFERLRSNVQAYTFPQVGRITVSIGYTEVHLGDTPSGAFQRADTALYWAKEHGRNQVCSHAELLRKGEASEEAKSGDVELF